VAWDVSRRCEETQDTCNLSGRCQATQDAQDAGDAEDATDDALAAGDATQDPQDSGNADSTSRALGQNGAVSDTRYFFADARLQYNFLSSLNPLSLRGSEHHCA